MSEAETYEEWVDAAKGWDESAGMERWRRTEQSEYYDFVSIRTRLDDLRSLRAKHDHPGLLYALNEGIHGNLDGMGNPALYGRSNIGTKRVIEDYTNEIVESLELLADPAVDDVSDAEKLDLFQRAHICFGRSALMLSGSGSLLYFHLGVVNALRKQDLLPKIVSGSSGGALIGCILASHKPSELDLILNPANLAEKSASARQAFADHRDGGSTLISVDELRHYVDALIPDLTFEESFRVSGLKMNVSVAPAETHQTTRLLNAITSPHVMLRESVMASAAIPGIFPAVTLVAKNRRGAKQAYLPSQKWVDGAISDDLPAKRLARLYRVNHYIVSQTNPHIIPFVSASKHNRSAMAILSSAAGKTAREWINAGTTLMRKPLSVFPSINGTANKFVSVINQDYVGDINILPPFRVTNPIKLLNLRTEGDILDLVKTGERATWPKLEMIRIQTQIGRVLDRILETYQWKNNSIPCDGKAAPPELRRVSS